MIAVVLVVLMLRTLHALSVPAVCLSVLPVPLSVLPVPSSSVLARALHLTSGAKKYATVLLTARTQCVCVIFFGNALIS